MVVTPILVYKLPRLFSKHGEKLITPFFEGNSRVEYILGRDVTPAQVLIDIHHRRQTGMLEEDLREWEAGNLRLTPFSADDRESIKMAIEDEREGMKERQVRHTELLDRDCNLLLDWVSRNDGWLLQFKDEDGNWLTWDETGFYIQIK